MINKKKIQEAVHITLGGLPLIGILYGSFLPLQKTSQQLLVLALLIWLQTFFIIEVFLNGR